MTVKEAVIESGRTRLRPILLTAPVHCGIDSGGSKRGCLIYPIGSHNHLGILFSAVLTLIIVPMLYLVFHRFRRKHPEIQG